jgi:hypothetical protein
MKFLFPESELQAAHDEYLAAQKLAYPRVKSKSEILLEVVADFPDATVNELAEAAERSTSWVRKQLRAAGVALTKPPVRRKEVKP